MKVLIGVLAALVLINLAWNVGLYFSPDKNTLAHYLFNVGYGIIHLYGAGVALWGTIRYRLSTRQGQSLLCFSLAMLMYALGLFTWAVYNVVLTVEVPYPSLADLFFNAFPPFTAAGFGLLLYSFGGRFTLKSLIELVIITGLFFILIYSFLNPTTLGAGLPFLHRFLNISYPAFDALLAALTIIILRSEKGSIHPNILLFAFGCLIMALGDTIFSYRTAAGIYWNGDVSDTLFLVASTLLTAGVITAATGSKSTA